MQRHIALFDLDGVVFDTESQYTRFWGDQFKEYFPEVSGLEYKIKGMTLSQIFDQYFHDNIERQRAVTSALDDFEHNMIFRYIDGFEEFVSELRSVGVKTAVVTSSNIPKMRNVYGKCPSFATYFDEVLTSEDFAKSKPDPDCYLKAAGRFGVCVDECVGFEDSFNGLKSLRSAGMAVVGLATTNPRDAVAGYSDKVIDDYTGLKPADVFFC